MKLSQLSSMEQVSELARLRYADIKKKDTGFPIKELGNDNNGQHFDEL
jgi:hypothetical protein